MTYNLSASEIKELLRAKISHNFGIKPEQASDEKFYKAAAMIIRDLLTSRRTEFIKPENSASPKQINYICMEFLMGRSLKNNLYNMGLTEVFETALSDYSVKLEKLYAQEPDAGLGNGGLGRLAACFLDGLASNNYPAMGYSILYEFGIFRQKLIDRWQTELPDFWLPGGEVWLRRNTERAYDIRFEGRLEESWDGEFHQIRQTDCFTVRAVAYDMMVSGYGGGVSVLRLWKAESDHIDMQLFNDGDYLRALERDAMAEVISKVLYPSDNHPEGKSLRLRQQYFLVSASVQDIMNRQMSQHGTVDNLPETMAVHINDTHPALCIPELMRILLDDCGYSWDTAWDLVTRTVAYTNHTVMAEALESWQEDLVKRLLPRIYQILREIDNRLREQVWNQTNDADLVERTAVISGGAVKMANLAVACSHSVNGVSELHSQILRERVFKDYYKLTPDKFTNVTNGIATRRWLNQANPGLAGLISELIGDEFIVNTEKLEELRKFENDSSVLKSLRDVKESNKIRLSNYVKGLGMRPIDPESIFDVQAKRLHEYKRQHLNALNIIAEYHKLKSNPDMDFTPKTYFFAAKAAPGYYMAKRIIQMICSISAELEGDPALRDRLRVIYLEDYSVSLAELLLPAADISQQISLAGTEASGTGNMKLMLGGAVTLGTLDGANVEIKEAVGDENIIIFGLNAGEAAGLRQSYNPAEYSRNNPALRETLEHLSSGVGGMQFTEISDQLLTLDPYMALADFNDYAVAVKRASALYDDREKWGRMSLHNIAGAGRFSSDRAIKEYVGKIWE